MIINELQYVHDKIELQFWLQSNSHSLRSKRLQVTVNSHRIIVTRIFYLILYQIVTIFEFYFEFVTKACSSSLSGFWESDSTANYKLAHNQLAFSPRLALDQCRGHLSYHPWQY